MFRQKWSLDRAAEGPHTQMTSGETSVAWQRAAAARAALSVCLNLQEMRAALMHFFVQGKAAEGHQRQLQHGHPCTGFQVAQRETGCVFMVKTSWNTEMRNA